MNDTKKSMAPSTKYAIQGLNNFTTLEEVTSFVRVTESLLLINKSFASWVRKSLERIYQINPAPITAYIKYIGYMWVGVSSPAPRCITIGASVQNSKEKIVVRVKDILEYLSARLILCSSSLFLIVVGYWGTGIKMNISICFQIVDQKSIGSKLQKGPENLKLNHVLGFSNLNSKISPIYQSIRHIGNGCVPFGDPDAKLIEPVIPLEFFPWIRSLMEAYQEENQEF